MLELGREYPFPAAEKERDTLVSWGLPVNFFKTAQ